MGRTRGTGRLRRSAFSAATLALLAALAPACRRGGEGDPGAELSRTRVPVGLTAVTRDSLIETLLLNGRLGARPGGSAILASPAAGVVRAVRVQVGDRVKRGESVVELDVPELAADARQKAAAAGQAGRESARQRQLLADGVTSTRQVEEAAATAQQSASAAAAARELLARTRIASPIDGQVQDVLVQRGERVDAGRAMVQVVSPDTLDLVVPVPAADLRRLRVGLAAEVMQEGDTASVAGRLVALAPGVDSLTNAGTAVIRVANRAGRLHPGAGGIARIRIGIRSDVLVVPDSAIVLAGDSSVVFVVGPDSVAHQRGVRRGVRAGGRSEVEGSLRPGDRVVTAGAFGLQDGMRVVPSASKP